MGWVSTQDTAHPDGTETPHGPPFRSVAATALEVLADTSTP